MQIVPTGVLRIQTITGADDKTEGELFKQSNIIMLITTKIQQQPKLYGACGTYVEPFIIAQFHLVPGNRPHDVMLYHS